MMSSATWDGQDHHMASGTEDDFHQFLDMSGMANMGDGMQFDFNGFQDGAPQQPMMTGHQHGHPDAIMTESDNTGIVPRSAGMLPDHTPAAAISTPTHTPMSAHMMPVSANADAISNIDAQIQYLQQQKFQQQQRQLHDQSAAFFSSPHHHSVPPTPQSLDMLPGSGHFYSQPEQVSHTGIYDRSYQQQMKEQDMAFTPLVSPAVTPLDPSFNMESAFTVPGAYFSPLTSPALHAQADSGSGSVYDHSTHSNNSPIEMDLEPAPATAASGQDLSKKARKNNAAAKTRSKSSVKSSPISKPQRRKTGPSPAIVSQVLSEVEERNVQSGDSVLLPLPATSTDGSEENASVSPENLTDMPPPPVPARRSTSKSPYIQAQNRGNSTPTPTQGPSTAPVHAIVASPARTAADVQPHPATPASLMKLPTSETTRPSNNHHESTAIDNIESLELPEAVAKRRIVPIDTRPISQSPRLEVGSAKTPSFQPLPSPISKPSGIASASQSPQLLPGSSGPSARKTPQLSARGSRQRSSSSVHVSPALLPRISPNIKPLLPGTPGVSAEDTASRLLMSKSNYQNILEGNQVPGVSYPSELSTNLTSKRTSHKIAEQGRRNRINTALQVMAGMLPEHQRGGSEDESDKKDGKQASAANSKASVVENAIVHMQSLRQENVDLRQELQDLKSQLEKLKEAA